MSETRDLGHQWLCDLLQHCHLEAAVSSGPPNLSNPQLLESSGTWLTIDADTLDSEQVQALSGKDMAALDAVQYLLNSTINMGRSAEEREAYTVELGTLRTQRYTELAELATEAADQVRTDQDEYEMPALSGAERRLIHTLLCDETDLKTFSRGEGAERRLIVCPAEADDS